MWRPTSELEGDEEIVDIRYLVYSFRGAFKPFLPHDSYKFLIHMMNGITKETVHPKVVEAWKKAKKGSDIVRFFKSGVTNQCFAVLSGAAFKCEKRHVAK